MFGGVIVYIDVSGYHGIVVSKMEDIRKLKWSTNRDLEEGFDILNSGVFKDGRVNTEIIVDYFNTTQWKVPVVEYCNNFSSGGYDD